jgi:hypothetical protein
MPNLDFYAVGTDFDAVLKYVFECSGCRVFESYSPYGEEIAEFKSINDISGRYPIGTCDGTVCSVMLQLVPPGASKQYKIQRISLNPAVCNGKSFRYSIEGWGLIQLYLGGYSPAGIIKSHTNHFTAKGAKKWESTRDHLGPIESWPWKETTSISSALNKYIRSKLSKYKIASRPVLPAAAEAFMSGEDPHELYFKKVLREQQ